ncbi:hypothetical protein GCM10025789_04030 [Tessaracoccus lubricantis]|uniref:Lipoprotein n=1 Tax=Tessaracoccus lubricantis TaxID=545543 RepID=A0ABP9EZR8_9ACTN
MLAARIAAPAMALLLLPGCAPETMVTTAAQARHTAPSLVTPTSPEPSAVGEAGEPVEYQAAADMVEAQAKEAQARAEVVARAEELAADTAMAGARPSGFEPTNGWVDLHIHNVAYSEVSRLDDASASFGDYAEAAMQGAGTDGCTVLGISVMSTHPDGYILGTISTDCGGGQAVWVEDQETGQWRLAKVIEAAPECAEFTSLRLPRGVGLLCSGDSGEFSEY